MTGRSGPVGVAVVGCGTISHEYLRNLTSFPDLRVLFCADIDLERAKAQAATYGVPARAARPRRSRTRTWSWSSTSPSRPRTPRSLGRAGRGQERLDREAARPRHRLRAALLAEADRAGLRLGCAPDTVLGAGLQTARRLMADGRDRRPADGADADAEPGPGAWHPDPEFLFQRGAGRCSTSGRTTCPAGHDLRPGRAGRGRGPPQPRHQGHRPRAAGRAPSSGRGAHPCLRAGRVRRGARPPRCCSASSRRCHGMVSWRSPAPRPPSRVPDPNRFDGDIRLRATGRDEWQVIPSRRGVRGPRPAACWTWPAACAPGRPHRASGELAQHVLEHHGGDEGPAGARSSR